MRGNVPLDIFTGWSGFAVLCGVVGLRQTCESVWSGGGLGPQPTAALVLQPDSRSALAASQELQDVDTEQGPRRGVQPPHVLSGHQHRLRHKGRHFYQARFTDFTVGRVNLWHNRKEWLGY